MAAADITVPQNGGQGSVKVHPYVLALIRWCISCVWGAGNLLLHRLMVYPLPAVTGTWRGSGKPRPASHDHLHPEPLVECVVLHQPATVELDVIFVHGLYGSLANTWRQGEWRSKYKSEPTLTLLRDNDSLRSQTLNKDLKNNKTNPEKKNDATENTTPYEENEEFIKHSTDEKLYTDIKSLIQDQNMYMTEKFYDKTLLDHVEIIDNYETQAKFVRDLFEYQNEKYESMINNNLERGEDKNEEEVKSDECMCKANDTNCEVGCGCNCDNCYSPCWPRDWIKVDYPNARVISINYTSDPHLWRPLWIKESKRLRLYERADQMMQQLLALGVGRSPIVWVGHSKGGLFIKQIYCEAHEAYLKLNKHAEHNEENCDLPNDQTRLTDNEAVIHAENIRTKNNDKEYCDIDINKNIDLALKEESNIEESVVEQNGNTYNEKSVFKDEDVDDNVASNGGHDESTVIVDELAAKASLWTNSAGFMFYSVPHRGSPLADFKTPITARSIELLEICKDCPLVVSLQERWVRATGGRPPPAVRSLVESGRTLMAVLWLRIVSVDSADAGLGPLHGVSLDHREVCKPVARRCPLYAELMRLIEEALRSPKMSSP